MHIMIKKLYLKIPFQIRSANPIELTVITHAILIHICLAGLTIDPDYF